MNLIKKRNIFFVLFVLVFLSFFTIGNAFASTSVIDVESSKATVTRLKGKAKVVKAKDKKSYPVYKGDQLVKGDCVTTKNKSRIELKLADQSLIRFDENTKFELLGLNVNNIKKDRKIKVKLLLGKAWAKVSNIFGKNSKFDIASKTAVAGVRGTTYRMNANKDNSSVVKVYDGKVKVNSVPKENETKSNKFFTKPRPIAGPHPVSMKKWTYILKSMQQININSNGVASKPFNFSPANDKNDWVTWNQELDEKF